MPAARDRGDRTYTYMVKDSICDVLVVGGSSIDDVVVCVGCPRNNGQDKVLNLSQMLDHLVLVHSRDMVFDSGLEKIRRNAERFQQRMLVRDQERKEVAK